MGLLENLSEAPRLRRKTKCRMAVILEGLSTEERTAVENIMQSIVNLEGKYSSNWLANQLAKSGHIINHQSILRHARQECCCES